MAKRKRPASVTPMQVRRIIHWRITRGKDPKWVAKKVGVTTRQIAMVKSAHTKGLYD